MTSRKASSFVWRYTPPILKNQGQMENTGDLNMRSKKRQAALLNALGKSFHSGHPVTEQEKKSAK
jgi:hypothetical protein